MNAQRVNEIGSPSLTGVSRRTFARMLGGGAAAAVLTTGLHSRGFAQDASQATLPPALAEWVASWEALDAQRNAATYVEDGVLFAVPMNDEAHGREAIAANLQALFSAFSDATARMPVVIVNGDRAAAEWTFEGNYTGQLPGMPPGKGQPVSFRGASVLELADGAIRRNTRYFDLFSLLMQTGAIPPEAISAQAPATPAP